MVSQTTFAAVAVILLAAASSVTAQSCAAMNETVGPFDAFIFARTWAPATCLYFGPTCNLTELTETYPIHGMWPNYNNGSYPQYCDASRPFNPANVSSLLPQLDVYWPGLQNNCTNWFYTHEWDKHGTCASWVADIDTEYTFFSSVLAAAEAQPYHVYLADAGIVPSTTQNYTQTQIENALLASPLGVKGYPQCVNGTLTQIWTCYSLDLKPTPCTAQTEACINSTCTGPIEIVDSVSVKVGVREERERGAWEPHIVCGSPA